VRLFRAVVDFIDPPKRDGSAPHALSDEERLDERLHEGHWWSASQNAYKARLPSADAPFKRGYRP
jgi:hypothetical protein